MQFALTSVSRRVFNPPAPANVQALLMKTPLPRREFVQLTTLSAAAAALVPSLFAAEQQAAPKKADPLRKAIMWGTVGVKGSVHEKMRAVKEAGFEGVEPNSHMNQDDVVEALAQTGLKAASVCCNTHWILTLSHPSENIREKGLDGLKQPLRGAITFGEAQDVFALASSVLP